MAPSFPVATAGLNYPVFSVAVDPAGRGAVVVGGGGGENKSGVPNRLTLFTIPSPNDGPDEMRKTQRPIKIVKDAEYEFPSSGDSVQSLASLATEGGLVAFAGVNDNLSEVKAGRNNHLRSLSVRTPPRSESQDDNKEKDERENSDTAKIASIGDCSMFKPIPETQKYVPYQRLLRFCHSTENKSTPFKNRAVGAMASAFGDPDEVIIFDASTSPTENPQVCARFHPEDGQEAVDLDLIEMGGKEFGLAHCTDDTVFATSFTYDSTTRKLELLYDPPSPLFKFAPNKCRGIRWISPRHLLILLNKKAKQGGAELVVLCVDDLGDRGMIAQTMNLPSSIQAGVGLDTYAIDQNGPEDASQRIAIAVTGRDRSLHIYRANYRPTRSEDIKFQVTKLKRVRILKNHHEQSISCMTFSPPMGSGGMEGSDKYLPLVTAGLDNALFVHYIPLSNIPGWVQYQLPYKQLTVALAALAVLQPAIEGGLPPLWTILIVIMAIMMASFAVYMSKNV
ncbi:MAG: hypothetical protein M1831_003744 [Alyxoria varia]|nr:MAG: hypothetical protein M1831_003744 [Alyxoria varia]